MTVEQHNVVHFCGLDEFGNCALTVSDHLPWDDVNEHLFSLQEKLNAYLGFIESGEIYENYPQLEGRPIIIDVMLKFPPPPEAQWFFEKATATIAQAGFAFRWINFKGNS